MHATKHQAVCPTRKRIVQVVTSVCAGGLSRYLLDLLHYLDRDRFETHLLCTHFEGPHFAEARNLVASATVLGARHNVQKFARLGAALLRLRPDVVHCHQEPAGLVAGRLCGVRTRLETIHMADYWMTDGRPGYREFAWACATRRLVYTEDQKRLVSGFVPAEGVQVVSPGLDLARLKGYFRRDSVPDAAAMRDASVVVGTVSRFDPEKGVGFLIEAAPAVLRGCPGAHFLLVGDGSLRDEFEQRCTALGIRDRVHFTGYQPDGYRYLGAMDIFVMPSLSESWGFTAMEAMAAGVPVVCSDLPGPTSFMQHGQHGLVVRPQDVAGIAAAVLRLADDPAYRTRLGNAGKCEMETRHPVTRMVSAYEALYAAS